MARYCKYCGKSLADDTLCSCEKAVEKREDGENRSREACQESSKSDLTEKFSSAIENASNNVISWALLLVQALLTSISICAIIGKYSVGNPSIGEIVVTGMDYINFGVYFFIATIGYSLLLAIAMLIYSGKCKINLTFKETVKVVALGSIHMTIGMFCSLVIGLVFELDWFQLVIWLSALCKSVIIVTSEINKRSGNNSNAFKLLGFSYEISIAIFLFLLAITL